MSSSDKAVAGAIEEVPNGGQLEQIVTLAFQLASMVKKKEVFHDLLRPIE